MAKDKYLIDIKCPNCSNPSKLAIEENEGWSFNSRGAEPEVQSADGGVDIKKPKIICNKCKHEWIDKNLWLD